MTPDNPAILDVDGLIADFQRGADLAGVGKFYSVTKDNPELLDKAFDDEYATTFNDELKREVEHLKRESEYVIQTLIKEVDILPGSVKTIKELDNYFDVFLCTDNPILGNPIVEKIFKSKFGNGDPPVKEIYATRSVRVVDGQFRIEFNGKKEDYVLGKLDGAEYGLVMVEGRNDVGVAKSVKEKHPEACIVQVGNNCYDFEGYVDHKFENIGDILSHPEILTKSE